MFGTGGQAITQLEAILTVRKIELVKVYDIVYERAYEFAKRMTALYSKKFNNVKIKNNYGRSKKRRTMAYFNV